LLAEWNSSLGGTGNPVPNSRDRAGVMMTRDAFLLIQEVEFCTFFVKIDADGNLVTGQNAILTAKGPGLNYQAFRKLPHEVREHHTRITVQSSQWFPHQDETGPLSFAVEDLNSVQKLDDWKTERYEQLLPPGQIVI
jgi:hypothetical protein